MMPTYTQCEHARINAKEYPGTRQLCVQCDQPTGRCEDDSIYHEPEFEFGDQIGPLCEECAEELMNPNDVYRRANRARPGGVKVNKEPNDRAPVECLVMPAVVGIVQYDVLTECPHCGKRLALNQYPYNDDSTEYSPAEDDLGLALFGTDREPAQWTGLQIEYICCGCHKILRIGELEI